MVLVRTTFQIKFGHMDAMMEIINEATEQLPDIGGVDRILTDATGQLFTLVFETKAESIDAHMQRLMESFSDPEASNFMTRTEEHIVSGRREFFNIEWERES